MKDAIYGKHLETVLGITAFMALVQAVYHWGMAYQVERMIQMVDPQRWAISSLQNALSQHIAEGFSNILTLGGLAYVFWYLRRRRLQKKRENSGPGQEMLQP